MSLLLFPFLGLILLINCLSSIAISISRLHLFQSYTKFPHLSNTHLLLIPFLPYRGSQGAPHVKKKKNHINVKSLTLYTLIHYFLWLSHFCANDLQIHTHNEMQVLFHKCLLNILLGICDCHLKANNPKMNSSLIPPNGFYSETDLYHSTNLLFLKIEILKLSFDFALLFTHLIYQHLYILPSRTCLIHSFLQLHSRCSSSLGSSCRVKKPLSFL